MKEPREKSAVTALEPPDESSPKRADSSAAARASTGWLETIIEREVLQHIEYDSDAEEDARQACRAVALAVVEECAKVCDDFAKEHEGEWDVEVTAGYCERQIRALVEQPDSPEVVERRVKEVAEMFDEHARRKR